MILGEIKEMLLQHPEHIQSLLEIYGFAHIHIRSNEIRFARDDAGGQNISIRLRDNEYLGVKDFVLDYHGDIIAYIMDQRSVSFSEVVANIKKILGITDKIAPRQRSLFGGIYENIGKDVVQEVPEYSETIMNDYVPIGNKRWLKDGISLATQHKYDVRYDPQEDLIVFPWRSATSGAIIAVKARINYPVIDGCSKYFYLHQGPVSQSLYNYSENYDRLVGCDRVFVAESEKTCMILDTWGIPTSVAIGSHALSSTQASLLAALNTKEICLILDKDLPLTETEKNIQTLRDALFMKDCTLSYWDWTLNTSVCTKGAPVDMGYAVFKDLCKNEIKTVATN